VVLVGCELSLGGGRFIGGYLEILEVQQGVVYADRLGGLFYFSLLVRLRRESERYTGGWVTLRWAVEYRHGGTLVGGLVHSWAGGTPLDG
jgi:hypothetical protein